MKLKHLVLVSIALIFLSNNANARYLEQMRRYEYVSARPAVVENVHRNAGSPSITSSQYKDGMNLYEYVRSNPVTYRDPSGETATCSLGPGLPWTWWGETIGNTIGGPPVGYLRDDLRGYVCGWKTEWVINYPDDDSDDGPYNEHELDGETCSYVGDMTTNAVTKDGGTETIEFCGEDVDYVCYRRFSTYRIKFKFLARYYCRYNHKWAKTGQTKEVVERKLIREEKWRRAVMQVDREG